VVMNGESISSEIESRLLASLHSSTPVSGFTHNFYRYPARMSPEFAREVITHFSEPGDTVLDPFMGGGTTLVEALAHGRRGLGVDLNPLAAFVATVKTTPLSARDAATIFCWLTSAPIGESRGVGQEVILIDPRAKNLPPSIVYMLDHLLRHVEELPYPRQRRFVRCALLRLAQWAVDCKSEVPELPRIQKQFHEIIRDMLTGLDRLVQSANTHGVDKHRMTGFRSILLRSSIGLEESITAGEGRCPRLVLTSPPYPAVHVLYNRWQVHGRRETPAPYWVIGAPDGRGASYFTLGGRTPFGLDNYFGNLTSVFRSVRTVVDPDALIVQLVSFSDAESQLPKFLRAMDEAGFQEVAPTAARRAERWRIVPNRKWYNRIDATRDSARELLLFHRPCKMAGID
jgi:hypothetical protein